MGEGTPRAGLRKILADRRFSRWVGSQFASNIGYSAWSLSVLWLAYEISGTLLLSALVLFIQFGIYSITFLAGPLVDRIADKRSVFLIVLPLQAVTATLLGIAVARGSLSTALLLGTVVVMALLDDFWWTAGNTVPRILVGREELLRANGLLSAWVGAGSLVGYAAGAALLILVGPEGGVFLRAGMLIASTLLLLPVVIPTASTAVRGLFHDLVEGWSILARGKGRPLLQIGGLFAVEGFFIGAPALLVTLFANREFGGSTSVYGLLFTAYMIGVIASGLAVSRANPRRSIGRFLVLATVAEGVAILLAVAVLPRLVPSAITWFAVGLAGGVPSTLLYSYLQATAPPEAVGRVVANLELFPAASSAVGAIVLGLLATSFAPALLGYVVGLGLVGVSLVAAAVPAVRRMRI